jgi:hypothetical protein
VYVGPPFVANAQPPELEQPSKGSFYHPAPSAQPTAVLRVAHREHRYDVAGAQTLPDRLCIITPVAQHTIGTMAWSPSHSLQGWNRINQGEGLLRVVAIGSRELDCEWNPTTVADQMTLAAKLSSVGGVRSCLDPPKTARTEQLSTTARDQSI